MNTRSALAIVAVRASLLALMLALGHVTTAIPATAIAEDDCAGAATVEFPMLAGSGYERGDSTGAAGNYAVLLGSGYEGHNSEPPCAIETSSERSRSDATVTTPATADEPSGLYAAILAGSGYDIEFSGQQVAWQDASPR